MSARILALTLIPNTIVGHPFWKQEKPEDRRAQLVHFLKNVGLFGGLLYVERGQADRARTRGLIQRCSASSRLAR